MAESKFGERNRINAAKHRKHGAVAKAVAAAAAAKDDKSNRERKKKGGSKPSTAKDGKKKKVAGAGKSTGSGKKLAKRS